MVHINFTSLLNSVGSVGSVGAWVRGLPESNFGMGRVGPQHFGGEQKSGRGQNFGVEKTYEFKNFCYDSTKFYLWYSLLSVLSAHTVW